MLFPGEETGFIPPKTGVSGGKNPVNSPFVDTVDTVGTVATVEMKKSTGAKLRWPVFLV